MKLEDLNKYYDELQLKYGEPSLHSVYNGGCKNNPNICFVFMNPTGKNISSTKDWKGIHSPWIGTKNIWTLFYKLNLLDEDIYSEIRKIKGSEWTEEFAVKVYDNVSKHKIFITNLGKCTQVDARALKDYVFLEYRDLLFKEFELIKPKVIILFGNQVSSIVLDKKISVSSTRKEKHILTVGNNNYDVFSVYYPIGNGIFNIDKSIEDILWIIEKYHFS